jgi:hypothetical protein
MVRRLRRRRNIVIKRLNFKQIGVIVEKGRRF